jgi:ATP-dependent Clp protease ATP-binding subunit ClpB
VMQAVRSHFKPEFLNRIDEIVMFHRLDEHHIEQIVGLQVERLQERLAERDLGLEITPEALARVAQLGYDPDFGARPLKRVLQREVADPIALSLLRGDYHEGDVVVVDAASDGQLVFSRRAPVSA